MAMNDGAKKKDDTDNKSFWVNPNSCVMQIRELAVEPKSHRLCVNLNLIQ